MSLKKKKHIIKKVENPFIFVLLPLPPKSSKVATATVIELVLDPGLVDL